MPWCILSLGDESLRPDRLAILIKQPAPERRGDVRQRSIGDVLTGKRLLVHPRSHVAGIDEDGRDSVGEQFDGEGSGQQLEGSLAGAIRTPAGIRLVRGVTRDIHDETTSLSEQRYRELDERNRRAGVDREYATEALDVECHERTK